MKVTFGREPRCFGGHWKAGRPILSLWTAASFATLARQLIRALIFDFDGLILETEEPIYRSWKEVYEARGVALPFEQ